MAATREPPILIAGGGIGGLAVALGLAITRRHSKNYRAPRFPRTAWVQLLSHVIGEHVYHPSGEHAHLRYATMSAKTSEDYCDDLAWLYGGTGLKG
jgi:hypothetical protein